LKPEPPYWSYTKGGSPTVYDRVMASQMGAKAVEVLMENKRNRVIVFKDNQIGDMDLEEALQVKKTISEDLIQLSKILAL